MERVKEKKQSLKTDLLCKDFVQESHLQPFSPVISGVSFSVR